VPPAPERGSDGWLAAEGLAPAVPPAPTRPSLGIRHGESADLPQVGPAQRDPSLPEDPAAAAARGKARLDAWLTDLVAKDRARSGPDVYWSGVRERLESELRVDWKVLESGPGDHRVVSGSRVGQALVSHLAEAERWAKGRPRSDSGGAGETPEDSAGTEARLSLAAREVLAQAAPENRLFVTELVTWVMLRQGPDGAVLSYEIAQGSGNAAYDRLVLERLAALAAGAGERLGPPPRRGRRTLWTVRTSFEMVPPAPVAGCGFDAQFKPAGCTYPLKRNVRSGVRLEAVWDGEDGG
jgi:hypothetical protein